MALAPAREMTKDLQVRTYLQVLCWRIRTVHSHRSLLMFRPGFPFHIDGSRYSVSVSSGRRSRIAVLIAREPVLPPTIRIAGLLRDLSKWQSVIAKSKDFHVNKFLTDRGTGQYCLFLQEDTKVFQENCSILLLRSEWQVCLQVLAS